MDRRIFARLGLGALGLAAAGSAARAAAPTTHRAVFQVSSEERRAQSLVLGNVHNYATHYKAKSEPFQVEIVVFGPGFAMVRDDISMMKGELETIEKDLGASLAISACANTRKAIAEAMGKKSEDLPLLKGVKETPSGVVRIAELQEQGWAYVRP